MVISFKYDPNDSSSLVSIENPGESIVFPKTITRIESNATFSPFVSCRNTTVNISFEKDSNLNFLGVYCFAYSRRLTNADLSNCLLLTSLNYRLFYYSSIEKINLPKNGTLSMLRSGAFAYSNLTEISVPDTVETIEDHKDAYSGVFRDCKKLSKIDISKTSKLNHIGYAIGQFSIVESFFIPKSVTEFNSGALNLMYNLKRIDVDEQNSKLCSIDDMIYNKEKTSLYFCACDKQSQIIFESTLTELKNEVFRGCRIKEPLTIIDGITNLPLNVFETSLFSKIILPQSIKYIKGYSFALTSIKSIEIPSSVVSIESNAFYYSQIKVIVFSSPESSIVVNEKAFIYCQQLTSIVLPAKSIALDIDKAFYECPKLSKVYYLMKDYPTNRQDVGTRKMRYYARIESNPKPNNNSCGDIEINAYQERCRIARNTCKRSMRSSFNILSLSLSLIVINK